MVRSVAGFLCAVVVALPVAAGAQAENRPPRLFSPFVGTWSLDDTAGSGRIAGLPIAHTIAIATSPTAITVIKDGRTPEEYRWDGQASRDRGGATSAVTFSVTLVAEMLALTTRTTRTQRGHAFTNVITDAYNVGGDVLTVERQLSVLVEPPGNLATLEYAANNRQTLVYRRVPVNAQREPRVP